MKWNRWKFTFPKVVGESLAVSGATKTDMYEHLKPILKRNSEFFILHQ